MDMNVLIMTGGKERSIDELFEAAGLRRTSVGQGGAVCGHGHRGDLKARSGRDVGNAIKRGAPVRRLTHRSARPRLTSGSFTIPKNP